MAAGEAVIRDRVISVGSSNVTEMTKKQMTVLVIVEGGCG